MTEPKQKTNINRLLWIDLEMSGLNVEKEVIIEAAALVTDMEFNILETYETVVKQDQKFIDGMDDWNKKHHGDSGLIAKIPNGKDPTQVEKELLELIARHWSNEPEAPLLCGNSINQDRLFIRKYWPSLEARLHYRMLDVSSFKIIFNQKWQKKFNKKDTHQAASDIKESVEELKFYLSFFNAAK